MANQPPPNFAIALILSLTASEVEILRIQNKLKNIGLSTYLSDKLDSSKVKISKLIQTKNKRFYSYQSKITKEY